ncbi:MAG: D-alanyl-D-alanine carboxypeptidase family protein [Candidatus Marsarchaeota archaeon]|nr:D-alanyl-D-alanine carboxypeptidase family protein [Candidatus Marsarchaeota archaeon]
MRQYSIDHEVAHSVKTVECGESLVDLGTYKSKVVIEIEETSRKMQRLREGSCMMRTSVAQRVLKAQALLPAGLRLKIIDSYRPLRAQRKIWRQLFNDIRKRPGITDIEAELETDKWVANPDKIIPQHCTGGTLDLTIVDRHFDELSMGSQVNTAGRKSVTNARLTLKERKNRNLLIIAMSGAGFANYKREWWHWSYGEWGWAYANGKNAIYGPI